MSLKINCLMLNNEIWALKLRLRYEYGFYDKILVTEARKTFSGGDKPLYFDKYRDTIADPENKITYIVLNDLPYDAGIEYKTESGILLKGNRWPAESAMRNGASATLQAMGLTQEDIVVVQDIDEIANLDSVALHVSSLGARHVHKFCYHDYRGTIASSGTAPGIVESGYIIRGSMVGGDLADYKRLHIGSDGFPQAWHNSAPLWAQSLDGQPLGSLVRMPDVTFTRGRQTGEPLGWHLSDMTGGWNDLLIHKINSFAHAECDIHGRVESEDFWRDVQNFTQKQNERGAYNFDDIDESIPDFIRSCAREFPILFKPRKA